LSSAPSSKRNVHGPLNITISKNKNKKCYEGTHWLTNMNSIILHYIIHEHSLGIKLVLFIHVQH
jgi:hypothetical protein